MRFMRKAGAFLVLTALVLASTIALNANRAHACSCNRIDAVDAIAKTDIVFTGSPTANLGTEAEPLWHFEVDGVIKGEVGSEEVLRTRGVGASCGRDFSYFIGREPIVVYASEVEGDLRALACRPTPDAAGFEEHLVAAMASPTGSGQPAAVMSGGYHTSDLAVLDSQGRTITRGLVGSGQGAIAHCPGTTTVAIVSSSVPVISLVDLESMTVTEQRKHHGGHMFPGYGEVTCLDDGATVIVARGNDRDEDFELTSNTRGADGKVSEIRTSFGDVRRSVVHPAGTVILLSDRANGPLRTLSARGFELLDETTALLPVDAKAFDGDISPDGSQLAMLVTLSGYSIAYAPGATHVVTIGLDDGLPVGPVKVVELIDPGESLESLAGVAKSIRWIDNSSWVIESETDTAKRIRIVDADGTQTVDNVEVSWGWGLAPIPSGVLRATAGGVEVISADGTTIAGDPAPGSADDFESHRLWVVPLINAPNFTSAAVEIPLLEVRPVPAPSVVERQTVAATADGDAGSTRHWITPLLLITGAVAVGGGVVASQRSRAV